jgi:hypothetical protein
MTIRWYRDVAVSTTKMSREYDLKLTFPLDWEKIIGFTLSLCVNKAPLAPSGFRFCLVNDFKFLTLIHLDYDLVFSPCRIFMEDTVPDQPRLPSKKHSATVYTQKEFLMMPAWLPFWRVKSTTVDRRLQACRKNQRRPPRKYEKMCVASNFVRIWKQETRKLHFYQPSIIQKFSFHDCWSLLH